MPTASPSATAGPGPSASPTASPTAAQFFPQPHLIQVRGLYPNPFVEHVTVYFTLRVQAAVRCHIYDVAGEPIKTLEMAGKAGPNTLEWLGENGDGGRCASGTYLLHLQALGVDGTQEGFWERAAVSR